MKLCCYKGKIIYRDGGIFIVIIIIYFLLLYIKESGSNLILKTNRNSNTNFSPVKFGSSNNIIPQSEKLKANFYHYPKNNIYNNYNKNVDIHRDKLSRRDLDVESDNDSLYNTQSENENSAQEDVQDFLQEVSPETLKRIKSLIAVNPLVGSEVLSNVITGTGSLYSSPKKNKNKKASSYHHHYQRHQSDQDVKSGFEKALMKTVLKAKLKHSEGLKKPKSTSSPFQIYDSSKKKPLVLEHLEIYQVPAPNILYKNENLETTTEEPTTTTTESPSNFIYFDHIISQVDNQNYGETQPTISSPHRILEENKYHQQQQQINNNNNYNNQYNNNQMQNIQSLHHTLPTSFIQNGQHVLIQTHPLHQYPLNNKLNPQTNYNNNNNNPHNNNNNLLVQHHHPQAQTTTVAPYVNTNPQNYQNNYQNNYQMISTPTSSSYITDNQKQQQHFIPSIPAQTPILSQQQNLQQQQQQQIRPPFYPQNNNNNPVHNPTNYNQYNQIPNHNQAPPLISAASHTPPLVYFHPEQQQQQVHQQPQQPHFIPSPYYHSPHYNNHNYFNGYHPQFYNNNNSNSNNNNDQKNKHEHHKGHHDFLHNSLHSLKSALFGEFHHHHHHGKDKGGKNKGDTGNNYNNYNNNNDNNNNNNQINYGSMENADHSKGNSYSQVSESAYNHYSKKAEGLFDKAKEFFHHHHQKHEENKAHNPHHHHDLNSVASKIFGISIMVLSFVAFGVYIVNLLFQFAVAYLMTESGMELIGQAIQQAMGRSLNSNNRIRNSSNTTVNARNLTSNSISSPLLCYDANSKVSTSFLDELERRIRKALSNHKLFS